MYCVCVFSCFFYFWKYTIVGGLPSTNIWEALIELDSLPLGFEVGHHGGVSHFISQAKGDSVNYPEYLPSSSLCWHSSTQLN